MTSNLVVSIKLLVRPTADLVRIEGSGGSNPLSSTSRATVVDDLRSSFRWPAVFAGGPPEVLETRAMLDVHRTWLFAVGLDIAVVERVRPERMEGSLGDDRLPVGE